MKDIELARAKGKEYSERILPLDVYTNYPADRARLDIRMGYQAGYLDALPHSSTTLKINEIMFLINILNRHVREYGPQMFSNDLQAKLQTILLRKETGRETSVRVLERDDAIWSEKVFSFSASEDVIKTALRSLEFKIRHINLSDEKNNDEYKSLTEAHNVMSNVLSHKLG